MRQRIVFAQGEILTMGAQSPQCEESINVGWVGVEGGVIRLLTYDPAVAEAWIDGDDLPQESTETQVVDCQGMVVMPGLINTHSHLPMTLLRNYADDMELHEWLNDYIWPFEAHLTDEDIYNGSRLAIVEMLLGGTTTAVDMYFKEYITARAAEELGMRVLLTEALLDHLCDTFVERMDLLRNAAEGSSLVMAGVAPHAPYTCSAETLKLAVEYAKKYDLPITTHLSETAVERSIIESQHGMSPLEYLTGHGVVGEKSILAHSIYLNDEEIEQIAEAGASIAHNPQSNMKLASGIAPIIELKEHGVNCTIATDGTSSNNDLDMWEEMRTALLLQRVSKLSPTAITPYEMLWMATRGAAAAIGRDDLGEIAVGKRADIVVVDTTKPHMRPRHNIISALIYSAKSSDVRDVMVDGVLRVISGEIVTAAGEKLDTPEIIAAAENSVKRILSEL